MVIHRLLAVSAALLVCATPALAQHGHSGGMGGGMSGMGTGSMGNPGGDSMSHMSSEGKANTNGPNATDRDRGADRAADRMSAEGSTHNNQTHTKMHKKHHHPG